MLFFCLLRITSIFGIYAFKYTHSLITWVALMTRYYRTLCITSQFDGFTTGLERLNKQFSYIHNFHRISSSLFSVQIRLLFHFFAAFFSPRLNTFWKYIYCDIQHWCLVWHFFRAVCLWVWIWVDATKMVYVVWCFLFFFWRFADTISFAQIRFDYFISIGMILFSLLPLSTLNEMRIYIFVHENCAVFIANPTMSIIFKEWKGTEKNRTREKTVCNLVRFLHRVLHFIHSTLVKSTHSCTRIYQQ